MQFRQYKANSPCIYLDASKKGTPLRETIDVRDDFIIGMEETAPTIGESEHDKHQGDPGDEQRSILPIRHRTFVCGIPISSAERVGNSITSICSSWCLATLFGYASGLPKCTCQQSSSESRKASSINPREYKVFATKKPNIWLCVGRASSSSGKRMSQGRPFDVSDS